MMTNDRENYSNSVQMTEYVRPNGMQQTIYFPCTLEAMTNAALIINDGFHFECETLRNGYASFTVGDNDGDYDIYLVADTVVDKLGDVSAWIASLNLTNLQELRASVDEEDDDDAMSS